MTTERGAATSLTWRGFVALMGFFAGLCTMFALVVTVLEAWHEHPQAHWPEATATIQRCGVDVQEGYCYIDCRICYRVGAEEIVTNVRSRSTPSPDRIIWEYPRAKTGQLQLWVDKHPQGTPITVHYDPVNQKKAVLVATDMPLGGPHTPSNMRLLRIAAATCAVLLTIARITRPSADVGKHSGKPPTQG